MAQRLSQIKDLLARRGLGPKKSLGQNFLHDGNHMDRMIQAAELEPGQAVLEVGAGTGALTERLVNTGARVLAIEIDKDLEPILQERLGANAELFVGDILAGKHGLNPEVLDRLPAQFKLIANLPYNIASPLLVNLGLDHPPMTEAVVMVQREVADRLLAQPSSKAYGPLGVILQALFDVERIAKLSPSCFWPQPNVSSAIVRLTRREHARCADPHQFAQFVHSIFAQRRKQLRSIVGKQFPFPVGISPAARPETLSVDQIAWLTKIDASISGS